VDADLVIPDEIRPKRDLGGKTPVIMCRGCLDAGVDQPCSGAHKNVNQASQQKEATKKRKLDNAVKRGRREPRAKCVGSTFASVSQLCQIRPKSEGGSVHKPGY